MHRVVGVREIKQRLDHFRRKNVVFLPQVEDANDFALRRKKWDESSIDKCEVCGKFSESSSEFCENSKDFSSSTANLRFSMEITKKIFEFSGKLPTNSFTDSHLVLLRAPKQMCKRLLHVPGEPRSKNIFLGSELMPRLPDNRVDHVKTRDFVLRRALENELLDVLHYVLVELDGLHRRLRDCSHFRLRDRDLVLDEREELKISEEVRLETEENIEIATFVITASHSSSHSNTNHSTFIAILPHKTLFGF